MIKTPLLDKVSFPKDLKRFSQEELKTVSKELKAKNERCGSRICQIEQWTDFLDNKILELVKALPVEMESRGQ